MAIGVIIRAGLSHPRERGVLEGMLDRLGRTSLKLLVAAAVLAWTSLPPAIVHSHSDGDDPAHRHEAHATHHDDHHHDSPDTADHFHAGPASSDCGESTTLAVHCHWQLFGFWFALPVSSDQRERADDRSPVKVALVDLADGDGVAAPTGISMARAVCQPSPAATPEFVPLTSISRGSQRPISATPLCDSARLERSGVLLA